MRQRCREATANGSNSPKVHRHEGNLATVQIKPRSYGQRPAKYWRSTTSGAADNGPTTKFLSVAAFAVNSEPHTVVRSRFMCVGPELARCVHISSAGRINSRGIHILLYVLRYGLVGVRLLLGRSLMVKVSN
jgi:hypothetical protein